MIFWEESFKDTTAHDKLDGLIDGISLGQENIILMESTVIVVYVEVHMMNLESVVWFL